MKVCPVCNEYFADELRFCDLDGTKLKREPGSHPAASQGRVWSLLGVGVLLGALVIATLSIIFTPRPDLAPTIASSTPAPSTAPSTTGDAVAAAADARTAPVAGQPEIVVEETPPPAPKKKEKPVESPDPNAILPAVSPKEAARPNDEAPKDAPRIEETKANASAEPKAETSPTVKPASDTREPANSPKAAATEAKKDKKAANSKDSDKESDSKKKDDDKEKKKGGFFRVFKKIFGKG